MIHRRAFLAALGGGVLTAPAAVEAQPGLRVPRIGYMSINLASETSVRAAFLQGLRDLGYVEGKNLLIEYRDAQGRTDRFPAIAAELVALKVDLVVTAGGTLAAQAAKRATTTTPIVFAGIGDPVVDGLVESLARPGGNLTGMSLVLQVVDKLMDLLKEAVPGVTRVALLLKPDAAPERTIRGYVDGADAAARALGIKVQVVEARGPEDFERAFSDMTRARAGALAVVATPVFNTQARRLADLATRHRLPTVFSLRDYVDAGGLMSYGPDRRDLFRRVAAYVDKILKGARPGELPVEQPTKFELLISLKTAKRLGLTIPPTLLQRADQVIQ